MLEESIDAHGQKKKNWFMNGIFIQGDIRNQNQRIYPSHEIRRAVDDLNRVLGEGKPVFGELDHPSDLNISLDRASHVITEINMNGANGIGKLKLLETPMGNIAKSILESDVKLGVSSRGSGDVDDRTGHVSNFSIVTVDIVGVPSAVNAYPTPIYESLRNYRRNGDELLEMAYEVNRDAKIQKFFAEEMVKFISQLKKQ